MDNKYATMKVYTMLNGFLDHSSFNIEECTSFMTDYDLRIALFDPFVNFYLN